MRDYRVYVIGDDGYFLRAIQIDCQDDNAAIDSAKQFMGGHDIELWQRDRWIARFNNNPKNTMGWLRSELRPPE